MSTKTKRQSSAVDGLVFIWDAQRMGPRLTTEYHGTTYHFDVLPAAYIDTLRKYESDMQAFIFNVGHIGPKPGTSIDELKQYTEEYIENFVLQRMKPKR